MASLTLTNITSNTTSDVATVTDREMKIYVDCSAADLGGATVYVERRNCVGGWGRYPTMTYEAADAWEIQVECGSLVRITVENATGGAPITCELTGVRA